jgi:hypothetical protein
LDSPVCGIAEEIGSIIKIMEKKLFIDIAPELVGT